MGEDFDKATLPGFGMYGTGDPDWLMGGAKSRITADLGGNHLPGAAHPGNVFLFRWFGEPPIEVQLADTIGRHPT